METTYTFRNIDASDALKTHATDKLSKLSKYLVKPTTVHVIFQTERFQHCVEVTLHANGIEYVSHEKSENMYTSIDNAIHKLEHQLRKYKERLKDHRKS